MVTGRAIPVEVDVLSFSQRKFLAALGKGRPDALFFAE